MLQKREQKTQKMLLYIGLTGEKAITIIRLFVNQNIRGKN